MANVGSANGKLQSTALGADGVCYADASGLIQVTAAGTSTQVLTSNGAGVAPTFQAVSAGVTGPGSSTNNGIATWNGAGGTALFSPSSPTVTSGGIMSNANQPAFLAYLSGNTGAITGDGTQTIIPFNSVSFDQGSNFSTGSNYYVCPVAGLYLYSLNAILFQTVGGTNTLTFGWVIVNGATSYPFTYATSYNVTTGYTSITGSILIKNSSSDHITGQIIVNGNASKNVGVAGTIGGSTFSGFLVA